MPFNDLINTLRDGDGQISTENLSDLSDLTRSEITEFVALWSNFSEDYQQWLISTLVEMTEESSELDFSSIFKIGLKSEYDFVVSKCIDGLWEYEDRSVIPDFIAVLSSDNLSDTRSTCAAALGKFGPLLHDKKILQTDADLVYENLMSTLSDESENLEVRRRCLESIAEFNNEDVNEDVEEYIKWAYSSGDTDLKASSIYAMGRSGETVWLPILLIELKSIDPSIRYESAIACGILGEDDVLPHLEELLQDDDNQVQIAACAALGNIGGTLSRQILTKFLENCDPDLEQIAQLALENTEFLEDPMGF